MSESAMYPEALAREYAGIVLDKFMPYIEKFEICGSLRRKKAVVHDVDLVIKPAMTEGFDGVTYLRAVQNIKDAMRSLSDYLPAQDKPILGNRIIRFRMKVADKIPIPIDIYLAETDEIFEGLKLIRTGSEQHNVKLAKLAKIKGMSLKASGEGLVLPDGKLLTGERPILEKLLGKYVEPEERN